MASTSKEERKQGEADLRTKLLGELAQRKQVLPFAKNRDKAETRMKNAKKKFEQSLAELAEARLDPDRKSEIADLRHQCTEYQAEFREKTEEFQEAKSELQTEIVEKFEGIVNML